MCRSLTPYFMDAVRVGKPYRVRYDATTINPLRQAEIERLFLSSLSCDKPCDKLKIKNLQIVFMLFNDTHANFVIYRLSSELR